MMRSPLVDDLISRFDSATPIVLLIDPMLGEPAVELRHGSLATRADLARTRGEFWGRDTCLVELDPRVPLEAAQMPYLVELAGTNDLWLAKSVRHAEQELQRVQSGFIGESARAAHRWGNWIQTSMHLPTLARHCAALMRVRTRVPVKERYLRLADRRVLDLWLWQVGEQAASEALGVTICWHYLDSGARIRSLRGATLEVSRDAAVLGSAQWRTMVRGAALHGVVATWFGQLRKDGRTAPSMPQAYERAEAALESSSSARQRWPRRFESELDDQSWAVLTLLFPQIERDFGVDRTLAESSPDDEPTTVLHELAEQLSEQLRMHSMNADDARELRTNS